MAAGDWNGSFTIALVIIVGVVCFSWIPIVIGINLVRKSKAKFRAKKPDEEKPAVPPPKPPYVQKPQPVFLDHSANNSTKNLERTASTRTHNSAMSWDPVRRWDTGASRDTTYVEQSPTPKNNSMRSNFSRPMPSRANSTRSVASSSSSAGPSRTRRQSINLKAGYEVKPMAFQINDTYYDTTPLPDSTPPIGAYAKSIGKGSPASGTSNPNSRRATPVDYYYKRHSTGRDSVELNSPRPTSSSYKRHSTARDSVESSSQLPRRASLNVQALNAQPGWTKSKTNPTFCDVQAMHQHK